MYMCDVYLTLGIYIYKFQIIHATYVYVCVCAVSSVFSWEFLKLKFCVNVLQFFRVAVPLTVLLEGPGGLLCRSIASIGFIRCHRSLVPAIWACVEILHGAGCLLTCLPRMMVSTAGWPGHLQQALQRASTGIYASCHRSVLFYLRVALVSGQWRAPSAQFMGLRLQHCVHRARAWSTISQPWMLLGFIFRYNVPLCSCLLNISVVWTPFTDSSAHNCHSFWIMFFNSAPPVSVYRHDLGRERSFSFMFSISFSFLSNRPKPKPIFWLLTRLNKLIHLRALFYK